MSRLHEDVSGRHSSERAQPIGRPRLLPSLPPRLSRSPRRHRGTSVPNRALVTGGRRPGGRARNGGPGLSAVFGPPRRRCATPAHDGRRRAGDHAGAVLPRKPGPSAGQILIGEDLSSHGLERRLGRPGSPRRAAHMVASRRHRAYAVAPATHSRADLPAGPGEPTTLRSTGGAHRRPPLLQGERPESRHLGGKHAKVSTTE